MVPRHRCLRRIELEVILAVFPNVEQLGDSLDIMVRTVNVY